MSKYIEILHKMNREELDYILEHSASIYDAIEPRYNIVHKPKISLWDKLLIRLKLKKKKVKYRPNYWLWEIMSDLEAQMEIIEEIIKERKKNDKT